MKVYLDDKRLAPKGWVRCFWPDQVINLLKTGGVTELSLDHDLGDDSIGKGIDVIDWLKEAVHSGFEGYPKNITIHSDNGPGRQYMELGIQSLNRLIKTKHGSTPN